MVSLIICLSSGKGTWTEVIKIIQGKNWQNIFLITTDFGKDNFSLQKENMKLIIVNPFDEINAIKDIIKKDLHNQISDFEVALNFVSGSEKEHMALVEAIMELGLNFRLITLINGEVDSLGLSR